MTDLIDEPSSAEGAVPAEAGLANQRAVQALAFIDRSGAGIEIGPASTPLAPKRGGFDVQVVDHLPTDELRAKYAAHGMDVDAIEDVDVVWRGEPLVELFGKEHAYDWIVASHVFEHLPDPVSFLLGCQQLLRPGGVLSLVIPDKRACFDRYRPLSTTGGFLDAFCQRRVRPTPGNVFDHAANAINRGGSIAFARRDERPLGRVHDWDEIRQLWATASQTEGYLDVHVWTFIPESFRLILADLSALGIVTMSVLGAFDAETEFFVSLTPSAPAGEPGDRLSALLATEPAPELAPGGPAPVAEESVPVAQGPEEAVVLDATLDAASEHAPEGAGPAGSTMVVSSREQAFLVAKRRVMTTLRTRARALSAGGRHP